MMWKKVKLGDVAVISSGNSAPQGDEFFINGIFPFCRTSDVGAVHLSTDLTEIKDKLNDTGIKGLTLFKKGTILIPKSGASTFLNHRAILGLDSYVSSHLATIQTNENFLFNLWAYYFFVTLDAKMLSPDTNYPTLKLSTISNIEIPLPPMEEQKKIAARLDAVSDLLAKQKQLLSEQDTLIQSTFYDMFGDPIKNEKGWKIEKLSSVSDSRLGKMLDAKKQNEANQYPYLANYNVQWFCFNLSDVRKMSFDHNEKCEFELKKGDVLVCEGGDVGRCAIWKEQIQECYFQKALHRVRCNPNFLNPIFLMHLFYNISICNGFEKIVGNKATIAHLTGVKLKALEIPVPPLELQQKFAAIAEQIESEKSKIKSAIAETQTLFNALMAEYFEE